MQQEQNRVLKESRSHGTTEFHCALYQSYAEDLHFHVPTHWHEELEIIWLAEGAFQVEINMEQAVTSRECFFFINSGELHRLRSLAAGPCREYAIVFDPRILSFDSHDAGQTQLIWPLITHALTLPRSVSAEEPVFESLKAEFLQMLEAYGQEVGGKPFPRAGVSEAPATQLILKGGLIKLLSLLSRSSLLGVQKVSDTRVEAVKTVLAYIERHYRERLTLAGFGKLVNLNGQYLCRLFGKATGKSPIRYVWEYRIHKAQELLEHTDLPVMEISLETGFSNLGNFFREFKQQTGVTPLRYRKQAFRNKS